MAATIGMFAILDAPERRDGTRSVDRRMSGGACRGGVSCHSFDGERAVRGRRTEAPVTASWAAWRARAVGRMTLARRTLRRERGLRGTQWSWAASTCPAYRAPRCAGAVAAVVDSYLFKGTVRSNLLWRRKPLPRTTSCEAPSPRCHWTVSSRRPEGLDAPVAEDGTQWLSNGQRQRPRWHGLLLDAPVLPLGRGRLERPMPSEGALIALVLTVPHRRSS